MNNQHKKISKMMSLILRHNPGFIDASLDENGWLSVELLINGINNKGLNLTQEVLNKIVKTNDKQRFSFSPNRDKIRANQGHSVKVDVELSEAKPPNYLYHGTVDKFMKPILKDGLKKMTRQHVHLSEDIETAMKVGGRRGKPIILVIKSGEMCENGYTFYLSENGVWLTDHVPSQFIDIGI